MTSRCVTLPPVPPAAHALSPCALLLPKATVYADPASTARPGAPGAQLLAQLESVRRWDVKFHYNDRKKRAVGGNGGTVAVGDNMAPHVRRALNITNTPRRWCRLTTQAVDLTVHGRPFVAEACGP